MTSVTPICSRLSVREALLEFLGHIKTCPSKVLRVMESVAVLCPHVVTDVIPAMTRAVKTSELIRGVGVDKQLRYSADTRAWLEDTRAWLEDTRAWLEDTRAWLEDPRAWLEDTDLDI